MLWIKDHLLTLVENYGLIALFFSIALETLGLPLPGETVLIASAGAAGAGSLNIWHVALTSFAAAVLGDNIGYLIGRRYGRTVILRHGQRVGITAEKYAHVEALAARYGPFMVVAARFLPIARQINGLVAGSITMPWGKFLSANIVGGALWVGLWCTVAYQLGHSISIVPWIWHHLSLVAMVIIPLLLLVIALLYLRVRSKKRDITEM